MSIWHWRMQNVKITKKAIKTLQKMLRLQETRFGANSEQVMETMGMIAYLQVKELRWEDGLKKFRTVAAWQKDHLPPLHPSVRIVQETINSIQQHIQGSPSVWI